MKVRHNSKVETHVTWLATIEIEQNEFYTFIDFLDEVGTEEAMYWKAKFTMGEPEPDGPKRPVTELKRKAASNGQ